MAAKSSPGDGSHGRGIRGDNFAVSTPARVYTLVRALLFGAR
ncbi:lariocidin/triculamin family lasso peptide core domain [Pseudonocardia alni]|jgi:hypothetical protein